MVVVGFNKLRGRASIDLGFYIFIVDPLLFDNVDVLLMEFIPDDVIDRVHFR